MNTNMKQASKNIKYYDKLALFEDYKKDKKENFKHFI